MRSPYIVIFFFSCFLLGLLKKSYVKAENNLEKDFKLICYAATYASGRPGRGGFYLSNLNPGLCTHVIFGYAHLKMDTSIYFLPNWNDFMNGTESLTELKQSYPSVKFMVALGGWSERTDKFSKIAAKSELRKSLAENAVNFLKKYDLDGLDLCWLYPSKRDGSVYDRIGFIQLLKEMKRQFEPFNYTLSALLSASYDTIDTGYDVKELTKIVDFMNMNTYDFNGFWSDDIQPNSPLYGADRWNVDYAISYMIKLGADPQKLILGIPLYGRVFISTNNTNSSTLNEHLKLGDLFNETARVRKTFLGPYTQDISGVISYGEICLELLKNNNKWMKFWDEKSKTPFITLGQDKLITYDNEKSIGFKVKYAIDKKLGGVTASALDLDDFQGDCSKEYKNGSDFKDYLLLRSIRKEINEHLSDINNVVEIMSCAKINDISCILLLLIFDAYLLF
ncbi:probable chitinase 2 isoform X1 [Onthophagus taurus]|uniref:probable chitinase 2 isoform X1 n=1 Tax=Onthophagus taurus TaxID=166361 RepID=UPI0039BDCAFE